MEAAGRRQEVLLKPIPAGYRMSHSLVIDEEMTVDFQQQEPGLGRVHQVYATYWLGKHFELVSRKLTLPFLEEDDAGIGFELEVRHLASALPGMLVELEACYLRSDGNRLFVACTATSQLGDLIGEGNTTQVIMPKGKLEARFARLRERWRESQEIE